MARVEPIYKLVDELPTRSITVRVLNALDFLAPGEWQNLVGFTETIEAVTGESDDALVQKIGERAIALYNDRGQGYRRAMSLYKTVDRVDRLTRATAGWAGRSPTVVDVRLSTRRDATVEKGCRA